MNKTKVFEEKVHNIKGKDFNVVGDYISMKTKIALVHKKCGYKWETTPDNFLRTKFGCPSCSGNARVTTKDFLAKVQELTGTEYTIKGKYVNARTKIGFLHTKCGYEYSTTPESFLNQGTRCAKCAGKLKVTDTEFRESVYFQTKGTYTFLDEYKNSQTKLKCTHNVCGYLWEVTPASFLTKQSRCPSCAGNARITDAQFIEKVYNTFEERYMFLEKYKNWVTAIRCRHECGHEWMLAPNNLFQGKRCPRCTRESKGEEHVRKLLEEVGVLFEPQKKFEGCVHKKELPFDFYIPALNLAVEYDGEQHYKPVNFGGRSIERSKAMLVLTQKRDLIKTEFCSTKGIELLRIPYYLTKAEVKELLLQTLNSQEVTQRDSHQKVSL